MSVSSIVWEVVQKTSAQVREVTREETQLELAAKTLAEGVEPDIVWKVFRLSESEMQKLLDEMTDQSQMRPL